jgi:hypothetical protein
VALANAPSQAVADQCQTVKTRKRNYRCVLTWFAGRWRNHQPKRAEKPHSKSNAARRWTALRQAKVDPEEKDRSPGREVPARTPGTHAEPQATIRAAALWACVTRTFGSEDLARVAEAN